MSAAQPFRRADQAIAAVARAISFGLGTSGRTAA
jgi:hypothetical protein